MPSTGASEASELNQRRLLQSIVEVARGLFGAAAASVFLLDDETGELVFEAVAGEGADRLPGTRFPAGTGIAGWTVTYGQSLLVDDLATNPQFARDAAESTGYVPESIMAAPLFRDGDCIGVLQVLDRGSRPRSDPGDLAAMGLLATETAEVLALLVRLRALEAARAVVPGGDRAEQTEQADEDAAVLRRLGERLPTVSARVRTTVTRLLAMAEELCDDDGPGTTARGA